MRILITGAAGFIGSHLMEAFGEYSPVGVDNFLTGRRENHEYVLEQDIIKRKELYALANDVAPEVVIHLAASYSDPDLWHRDTDTNVSGSINAASIAKHHDAHLIYPQTILPPISSYAISKIAGEQYLRLSGVPLTVLRLGNMYGPRNISGPIPAFYKRITEGKPCMVVDTARDMVFIDDMVQCVKRVVEEKMTGTFDICSGKQTPIMDLYTAVAAELNHEEVPPLIPPDPDDVQGTVSPENGISGWKATTPLREGVARTVASYRESAIGETYTHLRIGSKDAS